MIGYMKPVKKTFTKEERAIYQSLYCGLCRCLKYEYGFTGIVSLNYEAVNTLLLIGAMKPDPYPLMVMSCSVTPFYWRDMAGTNDEAFRAAAAVTISAAALEIQDNLADSNRWYDRLLNTLVTPKAQHMMTMYAQDFLELKDAHNHFIMLERQAIAKDAEISFNMLMEASGTIIAKAASIIGIHAGCQQLKELYEIMSLWGQWIYLLDAIDDYKDDLRCGQFNPLSLADKPTSIRALLNELEIKANSILNNIVVRNYHSIIYSLFHIHLPKRRELVLSKINMSEIEGNHHESSIQSEN